MIHRHGEDGGQDDIIPDLTEGRRAEDFEMKTANMNQRYVLTIETEQKQHGTIETEQKQHGIMNRVVESGSLFSATSEFPTMIPDWLDKANDEMENVLKVVSKGLNEFTEMVTLTLSIDNETGYGRWEQVRTMRIIPNGYNPRGWEMSAVDTGSYGFTWNEVSRQDKKNVMKAVRAELNEWYDCMKTSAREKLYKALDKARNAG